MSPIARLLLIPVILLTSNLSAQLNGTYTVGPTGTYTTLAAAITALQTAGVSGPVFMDIQTGTYTGNWTVNAIPGTSAINTVTFRSQAQDSLAVVLNHLSTVNPVVTLNGCSFVTWSKVTIGGSSSGVRFAGLTSDCAVRNCVVNAMGAFGVGLSSYLNGHDRITIASNRVNAAYLGITFPGVLGIYHDDVVITGNRVEGVTNSGINVQRMNNITVDGNTVISAGTNTATYINGIDLRDGLGIIRVTRNTVNWGIGSWAFYLANCIGAVGVPPVVENNMFSQYGVAGSSTVNILDTDQVRFIHNSVRSGLTQHAVQFQFSDQLVVEGNILQTTNDEVLMTQAASFSSIDHNVYYCTQPNVIRWSVTAFYTWATWRGLGWDAHSVFADPLFIGPTDLHIQAGSPAIGIAPMPVLVATDRDGDTRAAATTHLPDIGADERTDACSAGLAGTYRLGPSTAAYFHTFTDAVSTLVSCGIIAPVVFQVESGTYNEQITFPAVSGTSAVNTITFESLADDSTAVTLSHPSAPGNVNDHTLRLAGVDHLIIRKMTLQRSGALNYGRVVDVNGTSTDIQLRNNRFLPSSLVGGPAFNYAVVIGPSADIGVCTVSACRVVNGSGLAAVTVTGGTLRVEDNVFANGLVGLSLAGTTIPIDVERNTINTRTGAGATRGMLMSNVSGAVAISHNTITGNSPTFFGCTLSSVSGSALVPIVFENNVIIAVNTGLSAITVLSGTCSYLDFFHNSISCIGGTTAQGLNMLSGSGVGCRIINNAIRAVGSALRIDPATRVVASDNNVLFSSNGFGVGWGGTSYNTIATLFAASGMNGGSLIMDPLFVDPAADLHLQSGSPCAGRGQLMPTILTDHEGEGRPQPVASSPDAGADETPEHCNALSGTYTIGTAPGNDFGSFTGALQRMGLCGIAGPVLFLVQSGTYTEQLDLVPIPGNSATHTVTFRSQASDSAAVLLTWPSQAAAANNWVVRMNGADHVTWDRITIARSGSNAFANVLVFNSTTGTPGSQGTRITHCRLSGTTTATTGDLLFAPNNGHEDSVRVEHTRFENGTFGLRWTAVSDDDRLIAQDNVFVGQLTAGVFVSIRDRAFTLRRNTITSAAGQGMVIAQSNQGFDVSANRIRTTANGVAMTLVYDLGATDPRFYNNFITSGAVGILVNAPVNAVNLDNNSIHAGSYGVHFLGGTSTVASFRNNAIVSANYALYRQTLTNIAQSGNNALFRSTPGAFAFWNAPQTTLAAFQTASGGFASSVARDALFHDPPSGDLHAYAMPLDAAGVVLAHVTVDVDGQPRSTSTPDIGADEFQPQLWTGATNTCSPADPIISTGTGQDQWIYKDRKVVARFNDNGQVLGTVNVDVYLHTGPVRQSLAGQHYLDRNWHLITQNPITTGAIVRLFHSSNEFTPFAAADPTVSTVADAGVAQFTGVGENCLLSDNGLTGAGWQAHFPAAPATEPRIQAPGGTHGYTAIVLNDGELYISGQASPLPVELLAFNGQRIDAQEVRLQWSTASEQANAGFEVWRKVKGEEEFRPIAWVDGAGVSFGRLDYDLVDGDAQPVVSYYQLKQVDHDGSFVWSDVVAVEGGTVPADIVAFPNPAHENFRLRGMVDPAAEVQLLDGLGRTVRQWRGIGPYDLSGIPPGTYLLRMQDENERPLRLVVQ